jgi:hypothetical protein
VKKDEMGRARSKPEDLEEFVEVFGGKARRKGTERAVP